MGKAAPGRACSVFVARPWAVGRGVGSAGEEGKWELPHESLNSAPTLDLHALRAV